LKTQRALRESEERYRLLVETSPDPIIVHQHGRLVITNKATAELLGIDDEKELIGKNFFQFLHPSDWQKVQERTQYIVTYGATDGPSEFKIICSDGSIKTVETTGGSISYGDQTAVQIVSRDISERKKWRMNLKRESTITSLSRTI
jgi:PAS domain S-box-containing protein